MDWITAVIELIGVVILILWCVIPIREFKQILQAVHLRDATPPPPDSGEGNPPQN